VFYHASAVQHVVSFSRRLAVCRLHCTRNVLCVSTPSSQTRDAGRTSARRSTALAADRARARWAWPFSPLRLGRLQLRVRDLCCNDFSAPVFDCLLFQPHLSCTHTHMYFLPLPRQAPPLDLTILSRPAFRRDVSAFRGAHFVPRYECVLLAIRAHSMRKVSGVNCASVLSLTWASSRPRPWYARCRTCRHRSVTLLPGGLLATLMDEASFFCFFPRQTPSSAVASRLFWFFSLKSNRLLFLLGVRVSQST
jgi:hypothetical protein